MGMHSQSCEPAKFHYQTAETLTRVMQEARGRKQEIGSRILDFLDTIAEVLLSRFPLPASRFLLPASCFLPLASCFLPLASCFLLPASRLALKQMNDSWRCGPAIVFDSDIL
jgi:hypothetical protein